MKARDASRRRAPRLPMRLPGSLLGRAPRPVTVLNLSLYGCLVQCGAPLDNDAIFDIEFQLGTETFAAKARVADCCLDGSALPGGAPCYLVGFEFLGLSVQQSMRLRLFLEEETRRHGARKA